MSRTQRKTQLPGLGASIMDEGPCSKVITASPAPSQLPPRDCREHGRVFRGNQKLWGQACSGQRGGVIKAGVTSPEAKERHSAAGICMSR